MGSIEIIEGDEMMSNSRVEVKEAGGELSEKERQAFRESLNRDIEAFLSGGGQVQQIADNVRADPPKKPSMNYGAAPI